MCLTGSKKLQTRRNNGSHNHENCNLINNVFRRKAMLRVEFCTNISQARNGLPMKLPFTSCSGIHADEKSHRPENWEQTGPARDLTEPPNSSEKLWLSHYLQLQRCPEPRLSSLYSLTLCDFLFQVLSPHLFALRDSLLNSEHSQQPVARISRDILPALQKISCLGLSSCQFNPALPGSRTRRDAGRGTPTSPSPTCGSGRIFY